MDVTVVAHNRGSHADTLEANLGLHSGMIGDPPSILRRLVQLEQAGVDAIMVKCEPTFDESERFAREVIRPYRAARSLKGPAALPTGAVSQSTPESPSKHA
jgi:alkanesulfonate monooxygenase SsuD/methylene tetrahydromethanopterin reductase-like flavin-dependent oxidoreductase (luciferase family)